MKPICSFRSSKKIDYIHCDYKNQFLLVHPLLSHIIDLVDHHVNISDWINNLKQGGVKIGDKGFFSIEEIKYYYKKYLLLKENNYFNKPDIPGEFGAVLIPSDIISNLSNTRGITFEVTDSCNLKCKYCGFGEMYGNYDRRNTKELEFYKAKLLLDYLVPFFNSTLNFSHKKNICIGFYGGEPLLNFNLIRQIVEYSKQLKLLHNQFNYNITTNGLLLKKYITFLIENDFDLSISIDGNESQNSYRIFKNGKNSFPSVMNNILHIKNNYPDYFDKKVNIVSVLHNRNTTDEIDEFTKTHFGKPSYISELNTTGVLKEKQEEFLEMYKNPTEDLYQNEDYSNYNRKFFLEASRSSVEITLMAYSGYIYKNFDEFFFTKGNNRIVPTATCLPFSKKIFVTVNGKILPCERIGHHFALGIIGKNAVEMDFNKIAAKYNGYFNKIKRACLKCYRNKNCNQCIFNLNIDDSSPHCSGFMPEKDFQEFLSNQFSYLENHPDIYEELIKNTMVF